MTISIPDQLRNRVRAKQRLQPTDDGHQDPYLDPLRDSINPTMTPATIIQLAYLGCSLTREQYRHAWASTTDTGIRAMLNAVAAVQNEGWAA